MSTQPQAPPSQVVAKCAQCQSELTLILPAFRVMNAPDVTMVILVHEKAQVCAKCGAGYVPIIKAITPDGRMDIQWSKVEYQQAKPLIVPASLQQQRAVEKTRGLIAP